ncbi:beta-1,6-N-acetylglucosaminyltransferase [Spirosoma soli]|uniref:Peptide O-xylosyltransferase n=1 Tax=Spirosoma soli TaxID=1770529 RepID=A0ABW5MA71_9BACT
MAIPLRLAYLIFVHKNPAQLGRLLKRLYAPGCSFFIHVDAKTNLDPFRAAINDIPADSVVWLAKRKAVSWGDFSLSAAYLTGFQTILEQRLQPDFIITLSGQDYPIATHDVLHDWLSRHSEQTILDHVMITDALPDILDRVERYYLSTTPHRILVYPHPNPDKRKKRLFNSVLRRSGLFPLPRQMPLNHQLYFGTNWFQLKPLAARYILDFCQANPHYVQFFRTTYVPEEIFFQTILLNAPDAIRATIYNHRMTFMQWDRPPGSYVIPISTSELPAMLSSGKFFARKFEPQYDSQVLDQLDQYLKGGESMR